MSGSTLDEASVADTDQIVVLLLEMQAEVKELEFAAETGRAAVSTSFFDGVKWFLFRDEQEQVFGCCSLQSVHNYWTLNLRYYLGGFYIRPKHRAQGHFRSINEQLEAWVMAHGGRQIYSHIHKDNAKSLGAFSTTGMNVAEYLLCFKDMDS